MLNSSDDNWSGSVYCGDKDAVLEKAQRFTSYLVPVQLGLETILAPILAAIADRCPHGMGRDGTVIVWVGSDGIGILCRVSPGHVFGP